MSATASSRLLDAARVLNEAISAVEEGHASTLSELRSAYSLAASALVEAMRSRATGKMDPDQRADLNRVLAARARAMKQVGDGRGTLNSVAMQTALLRAARSLARQYEQWWEA